MFKLIIADDERLIREALSTTINWKDLDIELTGICRNGIEAYDMILDESPDIVLTDIRMPGMSGLDLIRRTSEAGIPVQFILLSGYGEFEYAKIVSARTGSWTPSLTIMNSTLIFISHPINCCMSIIWHLRIWNIFLALLRTMLKRICPRPLFMAFM